VDVGKRLRDIREAKGLSQGDLGRRSGYSQSHICRVEFGLKAPTIAALNKWCTVLGVSLPQFFDENRTPCGPATVVRPTLYERRFLGLLRRVNDKDRRVIFLLAHMMAKQRTKDGGFE
jgi:transcriptional regulator with XRE-family HTH domain